MKKFKCSNCNDGIVEQKVTLKKDFVEVEIKKCSKCKFQYGIKGVRKLTEILN